MEFNPLTNAVLIKEWSDRIIEPVYKGIVNNYNYSQRESYNWSHNQMNFVNLKYTHQLYNTTEYLFVDQFYCICPKLPEIFLSHDKDLDDFNHKVTKYWTLVNNKLSNDKIVLHEHSQYNALRDDTTKIAVDPDIYQRVLKNDLDYISDYFVNNMESLSKDYSLNILWDRIQPNLQLLKSDSEIKDLFLEVQQMRVVYCNKTLAHKINILNEFNKLTLNNPIIQANL